MTFQDVALFLGLVVLSIAVGAIAATLSGGLPSTGAISGGAVGLLGVVSSKCLEIG